MTTWTMYQHVSHMLDENIEQLNAQLSLHDYLHDRDTERLVLFYGPKHSLFKWKKDVCHLVSCWFLRHTNTQALMNAATELYYWHVMPDPPVMCFLILRAVYSSSRLQEEIWQSNLGNSLLRLELLYSLHTVTVARTVDMCYPRVFSDADRGVLHWHIVPW